MSPAWTSSDEIVTHVFPGTPSAGILRIGDRILTIDGLLPQDWRLSSKARLEPDQAVSVTVDRPRVGKLRLRIPLSNMDDLVPPLLTAFHSKNGDEWVIWTNQGYYDCSPGADRLVGCVEDRGPDHAGHFVSLQQLQRMYHRPDVVDLVLELGSEQLALERANKLRQATGQLVPPVTVLNEPPPAMLPAAPEVRFVHPHDNSLMDTTLQELEVKLRISCSGRELPRVDLLVNGATLAVRDIRRSVDLSTADKQVYVAKRLVPLAPGENKITAVTQLESVVGAEGYRGVTVIRRIQSDAPEARKPTLFVMSIGIEDYRGSKQFEDLKYATEDANAFCEVLLRREETRAENARRYGEVITLPLLNTQATANGIRASFDKIEKKAVAGDTVLIHVAAHGTTIGKYGDFCLVPFRW